MTYEVRLITSGVGDVATYDAAAVAEEHRGWIAGPFVRVPGGKKLTDLFEVKMGTIPQGEGRSEWSEDPVGQTFEVITRGLFEFTFLVDGTEEIVHLGPGQAVLWDNTVPHRWRALEDTDYFCVRVK